MKLSCTRRQRSLLIFLSASGYIAWFSGLGDPLEAADIASSPVPGITLEQRALRLNVAAVITRDPFNGVPSAASVSAASSREDAGGESNQTLDRKTRATNDFSLDSAGGTSVPNIGDARIAMATAPLQQASLAIRATIVGPNPLAYVQNGTVMDIVRVGDLLGERRIAKIDLRGLAFNDGSRLDLPGSFAATPPPARGVTAITTKLDDLKRLLTRQKTVLQNLSMQGSAVQPRAVPATAVPAPTAAFPTPGPLPTIDARGLPVGVNPTSNPNAPTPYPNPYPYAPPNVPH